MKYLKYFIFLFISNLLFVQSVKILGTVNFGSKSHTVFFNPLFHELAARGHEVTVITPFPSGVKMNNYREIIFDKGQGDMSVFALAQMGVLERLNVMPNLIAKSCHNSLSHPEVQPFIKGEIPVDLIISSTFCGECHLGFLDVYKVPLIQLIPMEPIAINLERYGNPLELASVPFLMLEYDQKMTFVQRLVNFLLSNFSILSYKYFFVPLQEEIMKEYFGPDIVLKNLIYNSSLLLSNSEVSVSYSRALSPNIQQVGGMHIVKSKPLPKDLKKWLDNAENGVIYFSMGSNVRGVDLPEEKRNAILTAFGKIKQRVLWKWENDTLPGQPENVRLGKWLPQSDLLAHPKIKAFITHGGLLSSQEATYHAIPIIGIPIMADQFLNMKKISDKGLGLLLDLQNITETSISWALQEIINNPSYKEVAVKLSKIMQDQPMSPLDKAVYWTEYILRHNGAPHLANPGNELTWYQRDLLDIYLVLILGLSLIIWIVYKIIRISLSFCIRKIRKEKND